ncbi:HNH endonuclease signature motif containing protein [Plesiomonas shigelloides]|uniref:HNH endonuclease signature motif containing protein n=1 Tax=Plesiomonas shigelloides TaxID=703 RepID=UPI000A11FE48|nr:HNH endonuclease signature motif containing protein [Plesiomonas shigelloides]
MRFDQSLKGHFNAVDGAYSEISTEDEAKKGQITLTDFESELVINHFGSDNIHRGKASDNPVLATKTFKFYNIGGYADLTLVYPKPAKNELRLYMAKRQRFAPPAQSVWFIFEGKGDNQLTVGYMSKNDWDQVNSQNNLKVATINVVSTLDEDDSKYQNDVIAQLALQPRDARSVQYPRSSAVGAESAWDAKFQCQVDRQHETFISRVSLRQYVEIHHLVPISNQGDFSHSLDIKENIIVLCPLCHKKFHHAEVPVQEELIQHFYNERRVMLASKFINITLDELKAYYGIS